MKTEVSAPPHPPPPSSAARGYLLLKYWLPVALLCTLIFTASGDSGSGRRSSRLIGPLVRWLVPGISEPAVERVVFGVRKAAHVAEFGALAWLVWRARRRPVRGDTRPWNWREAAFAFGFAVLFAASDEIHQSLVPNREGRVADVLLDVTGALLALAALRACGRWRGRW